MTQEEITQGNKLIAEFMGEGYWQIWKKKEVGGYKPYLADEYPTIEKCQEAIDEHFSDKMIGNTLSAMAQHKINYAPNFITEEYHSSWEWIMRIVEKIRTIQLPSPSMIRVGVQIHNYGCTIMDGCWSPSVIVENTTTENPNVKELTYKSVVEFIKWFNEQNKQ